MAIELVGYTANTSVLGSTVIDLTSLTGGIGSAPQQNDYVIVIVHSQTSSTNLDMTGIVTTSGYTNLIDLYQYETSVSLNLGISAKIMGSSPDTSVTVNTISGRALVVVYRGVDTTTPQDATATTATGSDGWTPDSPSITPSTAGAKVLSIGAGGSDSSVTAPSGYTNDAYTSGIAVASKAWTSGAENPGSWSGWTVATNTGSGAVTMALRPAPSPPNSSFFLGGFL